MLTGCCGLGGTNKRQKWPKLNRWRNTLLLKFSSRKSFHIKKSLQIAYQHWVKIKWSAVQCKVRSRSVVDGKEGFRFYIWYGRKVWQNFEMEICLLREDGDTGDISRQTLLRNLKRRSQTIHATTTCTIF